MTVTLTKTCGCQTSEPCSCPDCCTCPAPLTDDAAATREVGWVAREAREMMAEGVTEDSVRWHRYMGRKRALLAYIEAAKSR